MSRKELPYVFRELPDCPECGSVRLDVGGGTQRQDDGSKLQYATCIDCGCRLKILWEIPLGGIEAEPVL